MTALTKLTVLTILIRQMSLDLHGVMQDAPNPDNLDIDLTKQQKVARPTYHPAINRGAVAAVTQMIAADPFPKLGTQLYAYSTDVCRNVAKCRGQQCFVTTTSDLAKQIISVVEKGRDICFCRCCEAVSLHSPSRPAGSAETSEEALDVTVGDICETSISEVGEALFGCRSQR